jgi:hypothetical protein
LLIVQATIYVSLKTFLILGKIIKNEFFTAPTFEEAMKQPHLEKSDFVQPQASSVGWAVPSVPSAPTEKM